MTTNTLHKNKKLKFIFSILKIVILIILSSCILIFFYKIKSTSQISNNTSFEVSKIILNNDNITTNDSYLNFDIIEDDSIETSSYIINLSNSEISYYSSLSYNERLNFLFDTSYTLEDRIKIFLADDIDNIGFIYYDLNSGEKISINENSIFTAASTYKVGLNLLTYYLSSIGEINLNDEISYTYDDYEEGTGILYLQNYIGSYTIQELLDLSIIYSDNIATNMLGRYLGGHSSVRYELYNLLNIDFTNYTNLITPQIELEILTYIYDNKDNSDFSHLIEVLTQTEFSDRIDKYIPTDLVAHKVGTMDSNVHDVGIILTSNPYILSIYTNEIYNADEKIALISKAIYESY